MIISEFETACDRGILGVIKAAFRSFGAALVNAGLAIRERTKTPAHKHLDYIFSPEARRRPVDFAGGIPATLLRDIKHEQSIVNPLSGVEHKPAPRKELLS
jgi:hypothetical protein